MLAKLLVTIKWGDVGRVLKPFDNLPKFTGEEIAL